MVGDASKAKEILGWTPEYSLHQLITEMMESDLKLMEKNNLLKENGFRISESINE